MSIPKYRFVIPWSRRRVNVSPLLSPECFSRLRYSWLLLSACIEMKKKKKPFLPPSLFFLYRNILIQVLFSALKESTGGTNTAYILFLSLVSFPFVYIPHRINGSRRLGTSHPMNTPLFDYFRRLLNVCMSAESRRCLIKRLRRLRSCHFSGTGGPAESSKQKEPLFFWCAPSTNNVLLMNIEISLEFVWKTVMVPFPKSHDINMFFLLFFPAMSYFI